MREDPIKLELYGNGLKLCRGFLEGNFLPLPEYIPGRAPHAANKWQNIGLCIGARIWVDIDLTSRPAYTKGRAWSWPGYKTDRTASGVLAHETGHFISNLIMDGKFKDGRGVIISPAWVVTRWAIAVQQEAPVSGYEPVYEEAFAEAMRLYISNPDLLSCARPQRYYLIRHELGLHHGVEGAWRDVLKDAPLHIRQASANFAKETL